jgi:hypothetical protein
MNKTPDWINHLVLAADQFIASRPLPDESDSKSIEDFPVAIPTSPSCNFLLNSHFKMFYNHLGESKMGDDELG